MTVERRALGILGERFAARYLRRQHYAIVERNYRCPIGEIDLIAIEGGSIVFVEVKTRSTAFSSPFDAVDKRKQRQIARVGLYYLRAKRLLERPARFDVVGITWVGAWPRIELVRNAFTYP